MARYRVDNQYLSEKEYHNHLDKRIRGWMTFLGALIAGIASWWLLRMPVAAHWSHKIKFIIMILSVVLVGFLFRKLGHWIVYLILLTLSLAFIAGVVFLVWKIT